MTEDIERKQKKNRDCRVDIWQRARLDALLVGQDSTAVWKTSLFLGTSVACFNFFFPLTWFASYSSKNNDLSLSHHKDKKLYSCCLLTSPTVRSVWSVWWSRVPITLCLLLYSTVIFAMGACFLRILPMNPHELPFKGKLSTKTAQAE